MVTIRVHDGTVRFMTIAMEREYRLRWMDFDRYGRMQPAAILDIFQDLAIAHAESLGIGRAAMLERGVVWVVIRMKLEMLGEPRPDSVVSVRTWPHSLSKFSFIRDFLMRDEEGAELVKATQEWVLMNYETRRFASTRDVYHGPDDFDEARAFESKPRKIADFEAEGEPAFIVVPTFTDLDVNGHVNNAMYANFVMNTLNPGPESAVHTFQIDYRSEAMPGETLNMFVCEEDGLTRVKAVRPNGAISFASAIELR